MEPPETRYVKTPDGAHIAYQVFGDGPFDLVYVPGFASNVEHMWRVEPFARGLRRLGSFARVVVFDRRGTGMSVPRRTSIVSWPRPRAAEPQGRPWDMGHAFGVRTGQRHHHLTARETIPARMAVGGRRRGRRCRVRHDLDVSGRRHRLVVPRLDTSRAEARHRALPPRWHASPRDEMSDYDRG
jgi:hypothetical protein